MKSIIDYTNLLKSFFAQKQALSDEVTTRVTLGAHNLLPNNVVTQLDHGVTFTHNANNTVSVSGEKDDSSNHFIDIATYTLKAGTYVLSDGQSDNTLSIGLYSMPGTTLVARTNNAAHSVEFTIANDITAYVAIIYGASQGYTYNTVVKPMIRLATDTDPTYQPYAKTNRQLTEIENVEITARGSNTISRNDSKIATGIGLVSIAFVMSGTVGTSMNAAVDIPSKYAVSGYIAVTAVCTSEPARKVSGFLNGNTISLVADQAISTEKNFVVQLSFLL